MIKFLGIVGLVLSILSFIALVVLGFKDMQLIARLQREFIMQYYYLYVSMFGCGIGAFFLLKDY